jgi:glycerol-3-phosphate dehydrogenase
VHNGLDLRTDCPVTALTHTADAWAIDTPSGILHARFVVNAAGVHAGRIAELAGVGGFTLIARKGEEYLLDKRLRGLVRNVIYPCPSPTSKGTLVIPTYDGTIMVGPTADEVDDPEDVTTSAAGAERVLAAARRLVPGISDRDVIAQFAGIRAVLPGEDFLIGPTEIPGFINVAGIQSPGLTAAPAIAVLVADHLREAGLELAPGTPPARLARPVHLVDLPLDDQVTLAAADAAQRRITCRCELVTEAEIRDAIHRGARTLDGLKFRTRAGMGRCQGGFCTARCMELLSHELGLPLTAVTKRGGGSWLVLDRDDVQRTPGGEAAR